MHDQSERLDTADSARVVLVVEDEVLLRALAAEALRDQGFQVVEASHADEAMQLVAAGLLPDVLFTDVRMPGTRDGLQLAQELRAIQPGLVVCVASGDLDAKTGKAVAQHFFRKPYDLDLLASNIRAALGH